MSEDANALLGLRNAWTGVVNAGDRFRELAPAVGAATVDSPLSDADLTKFRDAALAAANAVLAVRGLLEEFQRKRVGPTGS